METVLACEPWPAKSPANSTMPLCPCVVRRPGPMKNKQDVRLTSGFHPWIRFHIFWLHRLGNHDFRIYVFFHLCIGFPSGTQEGWPLCDRTRTHACRCCSHRAKCWRSPPASKSRSLRPVLLIQFASGVYVNSSI